MYKKYSSLFYMPKIVKSIILDFDTISTKQKTILDILNRIESPLGSRLDQNIKMDKPPIFTNYSYFLTISMKHDFNNAQHFYDSIHKYMDFLAHNKLIQRMYTTFEFYSKDKTKLHAHALFETMVDGPVREFPKYKTRFLQWSREYFKYTHDITLNNINFKIKHIASDYKNPDVNQTWSYTNKDVHVMKKLDFHPLEIKVDPVIGPIPWKPKPNSHHKISQEVLNIKKQQLKSIYLKYYKLTLKEINELKKTVYS